MTEKSVVLISGSSRGIGASLARYFLGKGALVIGCSRSDDVDFGPGYQHFATDVADEDSVQSMFNAIREEHGHLDVLINNAGIASMNHFLLTPLDTLRRIMETNVSGMFLFTREGAKLMRNRDRGRIVNMSSVAVPLKLEGEAAYIASKAAVESLTRVLAYELAPFAITVNTVGPSPIKTDLIRGVSDVKLGAIIDRQAIRRFGTYDDVINVVDFFVKPESDFVTGQLIYLGGA